MLKTYNYKIDHNILFLFALFLVLLIAPFFTPPVHEGLEEMA